MVVEGGRVGIAISAAGAFRVAPSIPEGREALATGGAGGTGFLGCGAALMGDPSGPRICIRNKNRTVSSWNFSIIASNMSYDSFL